MNMPSYKTYKMVVFDMWDHFDAQYIYSSGEEALEAWRAAVVALTAETFTMEPARTEHLATANKIRFGNIFAFVNTMVRRGKFKQEHVIAVAAMIFDNPER